MGLPWCVEMPVRPAMRGGSADIVRMLLERDFHLIRWTPNTFVASWRKRTVGNPLSGHAE